MIEIINLEKLSNDGFKQPANNPGVATPDNITHAQLRYNTFSSSYVVQGSAIYNSSSTFEFDISYAIINNYSLFKLYVSTDGTTYTEKKSYGGEDGKTLGDAKGGIYSAIVNQSGTSAPTVQTLINSTGATATWTRAGLGSYLLTFSANLFNLNKAELPNSMVLSDGTTGGPLGVVLIDANSATLNSVVIATVNPTTYIIEDSIMNSYFFKITFYPL